MINRSSPVLVVDKHFPGHSAGINASQALVERLILVEPIAVLRSNQVRV